MAAACLRRAAAGAGTSTPRRGRRLLHDRGRKDFPEVLREDEGVRLYCCPTHWEWQRWYSRDPLSAFITGQTARGIAQRQPCSDDGASNTPANPMTCSISIRRSSFSVYAHRRRLCRRSWSTRKFMPPASSPGTVASAAWRHAARVAQRRLTARAMLVGRAARQRRDIRLVRRVIAPSRVFASHIATDYGVPLDRISVVPNPIDLTPVRAPRR